MASRGSSPSAKPRVNEPGKRSGAWLKYKINKSQEFVIAGYTPGTPLDALIVGYYDGDELIYAAKVRNGLLKSATALYRDCAVKYGRSLKDWRRLCVRPPTCLRRNALSSHSPVKR